jgi:hypothetical protein
MEFVLSLHSLVRFALLLAAIVGLVKALVSIAQKSAMAKIDQTLSAIFVGLFDLQALLGLLVILLGGLKGPLHPILMFVALVIAHWIKMIIQRAEGANVSQLRLALYALPLAIILLGLALIGRLPV